MTRFNRTWIPTIVLLAGVCVVGDRVTGRETPSQEPLDRSMSAKAPARGAERADIATIKNVTLTEVDEAGGVISFSFGKKDSPTKLVNVPLAGDVRLVASHVVPTLQNHLPFAWEDLKQLKGKVVSVRIRAPRTGSW